jgi:hypothetical protein
MRCKLVLRSKEVFSEFGKPAAKVRMGAVWEGSTEKQQASENAVFGAMTPMAEFNATIYNEAVLEQLEQGRTFYVDFTLAPA